MTSEMFHYPEHANITRNQTAEVLDRVTLGDVTLISGIDNKKITAHQVILSLFSRYFKAMFASSMRESVENVIELDNIHSDFLEPLIQFCYTGNIILCDNSVQSLMETASFLQIDPVVDACGDYILKQLDLSNCLGFLLFSEMHTCKRLHSSSMEFCEKNFLQLHQSEEFPNLEVNTFINLLSSDKINVDSEEDVFKTLEKWIQYEEEKRKKFAPQLLSLVRMPFLSTDFLTNRVKPFCESNGCDSFFSKVLEWHLNPEGRSQLSIDKIKPRRSTLKQLIAVTYRHGTITFFQRELDEWVEKKSISNICSDDFFTVATMNNKIFICGGGSHAAMLDCVNFDSYNDNSMKSMTGMTIERSRQCLIGLQDRIYAIGGYYNNFHREVERWNSNSNTWKFVNPMMEKRNRAGAVVYNNCIYVFGGWNGHRFLTTTECYDPNTNRWTTCARMAVAREDFGVALLNGFIYIVGGHNGLNCGGSDRTDLTSVERYDVSNNTWTIVASLNRARFYVYAAVIDGILYAFSGHERDEGKGIEEYDEQNDEWKISAKFSDDIHMVKGIFEIKRGFW